MNHTRLENNLFATLKDDFGASIVVFFVALPLCLGIALASGAPLFSGVIAGIIGGIIVGIASGSKLGVSGPAAGLAVIVLEGIENLGSFEIFLVAIVLAGIIQLMMGYSKLGFIAYFFPNSVITGMLSGIGILIILKQIPFALGYEKGSFSDEAFSLENGENTLTILSQSLDFFTPGAILISILSVLLIIIWNTLSQKHDIFKAIPGPIAVIALGILMTYLYQQKSLPFVLTKDELVSLPILTSIADFSYLFTFPDFAAALQNQLTYKTAIVIAIIASLETLLCVEATDKLDPLRRVTPSNQELKAQGLGNIISGLIGGLPITQVIVRSSANITFGAKSKLSAILHGFWLLISVITIATLLNKIPLASLSIILIFVGYKLSQPILFHQMYKLGFEQFIPFIVTIVAIIFTDLLTGVMSGVLVGLGFALHHSYRNSYFMKDVIETEDGKTIHHIQLAQEVSFFNKASIIEFLEKIPSHSKVILDFTHSRSVSYDVAEYIKEYILHAPLKGVEIETVNFNPKS